MFWKLGEQRVDIEQTSSGEKRSEWVIEWGRDGRGGVRVDNIDLNTCKHIWLSVIQLFCWWWKRRRGSWPKKTEWVQTLCVEWTLQKKVSFYKISLHTPCLPVQRMIFLSHLHKLRLRPAFIKFMIVALYTSVLCFWTCITYTLVIKPSVLHIQMYLNFSELKKTQTITHL